MMNINSLINFIKGRKKFIVFSLFRVLVSVLGLITNIIIVRKLSVGDFGIFSIALMLVGFVTTFGFSWSSSSILYYGGKERAKYGSINKTFWARNIIIFFSLLVVTIIFIIFRQSVNDYIGIEVAYLILIWLFISVSEDYLNQYFLVVKKQLLSSMLSVTAKLIFLVLVFLVSFDVTTLIILNIISHASVLLYVFAINRKDIGKYEFDRSWFKEVLNFSLWQLFGFSGLYLINFGDIAVIKYFLSIEDVGIYNTAFKLFASISGLSYVISSFYASNLSSYLVNKQFTKIKHFFYKERFIIFIISFLIQTVVIIYAKPIIILLYGERYLESAKLFKILMMGSILSYLSVFYMLYYNTNQKYKIQQSINILRALLNVALNIILIPRFGLIGAAFATTLAIAITFLISALYCEKRIKRLSIQ